LSEKDVGKNRAEATLKHMQELNERVKLVVDNSSLNEDFLKKFTVRLVHMMSIPPLITYMKMTRHFDINILSISCDLDDIFVIDCGDDGQHVAIVAEPSE